MPLLAAAAALAIGGLYILQAHPRVWPLPRAENMKAQGAVLDQLCGDDPATPGTDGHELDLGEPFSDRALYDEWLNDEHPPSFRPLTVGGAIDYERPRAQLRFAREVQVTRQAALVQAAQARGLAAERRVHDAEQATAQQAHDEQARREQAAQEVAAAATAKTVACNTARANAWGHSHSADEFIAWVRSHPCPEGTDIGDGYWKVAH